jgi:virginiamycin B lyase
MQQVFQRILLTVLGLLAPVFCRVLRSEDFTLYPVPLSFFQLSFITTGPDGNLWFTGGNQIGRMTSDGVVTAFPLPPVSSPSGITVGPDGNLWFSNSGTSTIGRISTTGDITLFPVPTEFSSPVGITSGPDGALWFTEESLSFGSKVGRITTGGAAVEFPLLTTRSQPFAIVAGPDGNLWFTEAGADRIGQITTSGLVTEFPLPAKGAPGGSRRVQMETCGSPSGYRRGLAG